MLRPAVDRADGDDDGIERIVFAAGDGLPGVNDLRGKDDRVLRPVRIGAVAAHSRHGHVDRIDIGVGVTGGDADVVDLQLRVVVKPKREIRFGKPRVKAILQQRLGPADGFFSRLSDKNDRAVPLVF